MPLHIEMTGRGKPLVMLHGWGMHGGIWGDMTARFSPHFQVHRVDLPGYGETAPLDVFSLDRVAGELAARFGRPVDVCGWSLGGQIALHWAAREPEQIRRVILVTSTPCFAERGDWPYGMAQGTLRNFAAELEKDLAATLRRFLSLQLRGSDREREVLALLRERLFSRGEPDMSALRGGLPKIMQPALVIAGDRDRLCPADASRYLADHLPHGRLALIRGAAHAPFLSHADEFSERVINFLNE